MTDLDVHLRTFAGFIGISPFLFPPVDDVNMHIVTHIKHFLSDSQWWASCF